MPENVTTLTSSWKKLRATNFTDNSFTRIPPSKTFPSGDGHIFMRSTMGRKERPLTVQNLLQLKFFGAGADNQTFDVRVTGIEHELDNDSWETCLLAQFACIMGNLAGVANCAIGASDFEVDTISLTYGATDVVVNSPGNDVSGAYVAIDFLGFSIIKVEFDVGTATSANCLYRIL